MVHFFAERIAVAVVAMAAVVVVVMVAAVVAVLMDADRQCMVAAAVVDGTAAGHVPILVPTRDHPVRNFSIVLVLYD